MKKVLLVGDIGTDENRYYHIGDEIMFFNNYQALKKNGYEIYVSSRNNKSNYKNVIEDINFSGCFRLFKLIIILLGYRFFSKSSKLKKIDNVIKNIDNIIISGGGNLNSIWKGHLYYRFLIAYISKKYKKDFYLSAQTIGPIYGIIDKILLNYILRYCNIIGLRDKSYSINYIDNKFHNKIHHFYDDALLYSNYNKSNDVYNKSFCVGLSLHSNINDEKLSKMIYNIKNLLEKHFKNIKYYAIPHVVDNNGGYDENFMKKFSFINYYFKSNKTHSYVENIYKKMDLVITTRYHGGVLSIKYGIPVIMVGRNSYEIGKFNGLNELIPNNISILLQDSESLSEKQLNTILHHKSYNLPNISEGKFFIYNFIKQYDKNKIN